MDAVYSFSLLVSLIAGGIGTVTAVLAAIWPRQARKLGHRGMSARYGCGVVALSFGLVSVSVHLVFGHGQQSAEPMAATQFFSHHKAYWLVLLFVFLTFGTRRLAGIGRRGGSEPE